MKKRTKLRAQRLILEGMGNVYAMSNSMVLVRPKKKRNVARNALPFTKCIQTWGKKNPRIPIQRTRAGCRLMFA